MFSTDVENPPEVLERHVRTDAELDELLDSVSCCTSLRLVL